MMDYLTYHLESSKIRDIDPANDVLKYVCERFELTEEQRYWLAFLYSTCYSGVTVFYMYQEFPDYENVNVGRLQRWWTAHKKDCVFQTDRLKIKTMDKLVETFESYRSLIGSGKQADYFNALKGSSLQQNYLNAYEACSKIRNVGRFTLFIYLEMVNVLTNFKCEPDRIDWKHAENCKMGLVYAQGWQGALSVPYDSLSFALHAYCHVLKVTGCEHHSIFNVETTLCAYKKYRHGKRYIGYYIDRQLKEINQMKKNIKEGVAWRVMDEFREETYKHLNHAKLFIDGSLRDGQDLGDERTYKGIQIG